MARTIGRKSLERAGLILFFTSEHCLWCKAVRDMIDTESSNLGVSLTVCEIDVDHEQSLAKAFNIRIVPTLMYRQQVLKGFPDESDLRTFLLQVAADRLSSVSVKSSLSNKLSGTVEDGFRPPPDKPQSSEKHSRVSTSVLEAYQ